MIAAFAGSLVLLLFSHFMKVLRWGQMTNIYNETSLSRLMSALSAGYVINYLVPFRIGEVVRAYIASRKTNSGFVFYFATVVIERLLDFLCVFLLFGALYFLRPAWQGQVLPIVVNYSIMLGVVCLASVLAFLFRAPLKRLVLWGCSIFNEQIKLQGLLFAFSGITLVKDFFRRINKGVFALLSVVMWAGYLGSYYLFVQALQPVAPGAGFIDLLTVLFGAGNLFIPQIMPISAFAQGSWKAMLLFTVYIFSPLVLMLVFSRLLRRRGAVLSAPIKRAMFKGERANVLPIADPKSRLDFLQSYFKGVEGREFYQAYIDMNKDIYVLQDLSGGSRATTVQILKDGEVFYRKYAFDAGGEALRRQTAWMAESPIAHLPRVASQFENSAGFCYDMEYDPEAKDFFTYIHTNDAVSDWDILNSLLADMRDDLHAPTLRPSKKEARQRYIDEKILRNRELVLQSPLLAGATQPAQLVVNGVAYPNLRAYDSFFEVGHLSTIFQNDEAARIHGDLTIENIIYAPARPHGYYLIDPNPENIHNTPFIDYAKLLQSLQYGYEFLQKTTTLEAEGNQVVFPSMRSGAYDELLKRYQAWLAGQFDENALRSIYAHEVANVLRLLPYKMEKTPRTAILYYAGLVMLMNRLKEEGWA